MKHVVPLLEIGSRIIGEVVEVLDDHQLLVTFSGDLLRVANVSRRQLLAGDRVSLVVESMHPLTFRLSEGPSAKRRRGRFDVQA